MVEPIVKSNKTLWKQILMELEGSHTKATYSQNFAGSELVEVKDDELVVVVRNKLASEWINKRLADSMSATASKVVGAPVTVKAITNEELNAQFLGDGAQHPPNGSIQVKYGANGDAPTVTGYETAVNGTTPLNGSDGLVELKGPVSRTKAHPTGSYEQISHYAIRFWRPLLGRLAFDVWEVVQSLKTGVEFGWNDPPKLSTIMRHADIKNREQFNAAIDTLIEFDLLAKRHSNIKGFKYEFEVFDIPVMTRMQHGDLNSVLKRDHLEWLSRFADNGYFDMDKWARGEAVDKCFTVEFK